MKAGNIAQRSDRIWSRCDPVATLRCAPGFHDTRRPEVGWLPKGEGVLVVAVLVFTVSARGFRQ